jgi:hypothetical protein
MAMSPITYREFGCVVYEGVSVGAGLPQSIDMGDGQRVVFVALQSVGGFPCGALSRFSCTTGGRFAVKLGFLIGLQRCRYASDT